MLQESVQRTAEYQKLRAALSLPRPAALFGLPPVGRAQLLAALLADTGLPGVVICADEASATRFASDAAFFGAASRVLPTRDLSLRRALGESREYEYRRLSVLGDIVGGRCSLVCCSAEAALQLTMPRFELLQNTLTLKEGDSIRQEKLVERLLAAGYHRRDRVEGAGQFAVRGGIVDLFAPDMQRPARIEFWGDVIDTMSGFDLLSQRREVQLKKIHISPAREVLFADPQKALALIEDAISSQKGQKKKALEEATAEDRAVLAGGAVPESMDKYLPLRYPQAATVLDYFEKPVLFFEDVGAVKEACRTFGLRFSEEIKSLLEQKVLAPALVEFYRDYPWLQQQTSRLPTILSENFLRSIPDFELGELVNMPAHALPAWGGEVKTLVQDLSGYTQRGYFCAVLTGTPRAAAALARDLSAAGLTSAAVKGSPMPSPGTVAVLPGHLSAGCDWPGAKFVVITSRRQQTEQGTKVRKKPKGLSSLEDIKPGDYVVHQNHGIGMYLGIERLDLQGVVKDYIKIQYAGADVLYVAVTQLDVISRYTAPGDEEKVKLAKLGGTEWQKTKTRVKKATEEMAKELIELYAKRQKAPGFAFPEDGDWQRDFETRFAYDETDDQLKSSAEIKHDMERPVPMDRLLCGDVGVGKTEVALRAAFKAIMGGKQVAVLVPTTILAWQHYNTILQRMEAFPVKAAMLSRFCTPKQTKDAVRGLAAGTVDIVVGTHRLLQKDVKFKQLGLVIIDEEQRFGVKHKEKLKQAFTGVDVLTLSATPIPRTLNMAMSGIRDMSTIEQPPFERQPVETYVLEYDPGVVGQAIGRELGRGGQVYYLHNRVETIEECAARVAKLAPGARIATAHGKMTEEQLSDVWQKLMDGEVDILVCTTIIETGVDVRNCNTLIIEDADRMGLAQLYQIRGRVGRSGRKAYAYFTFRPAKVLSDVAVKRLSAIREFTAFGSGFRIAMRDLQIRGAGSLLGHSQHGHMEAVGYELYVKLLNQAVAAQRGEAPPVDKADCLIDVRMDAYLPERYIPDQPSRIEAYKRIAAIQTQEDADDVLEELDDRYGEPPKSARALVEVSLARVQAANLGVYEICQRADQVVLYSDAISSTTSVPLVRALAGRASFHPGKKPYLTAAIKTGEEPLFVLRLVLDKMAWLRDALAEAEKKL
ncbi:MAG: transcription-repair coupling factor [Pygmaiobacter massiliensis]|nr:transcription-repair coupling factor [Pygmaiobacter massiliensis]